MDEIKLLKEALTKLKNVESQNVKQNGIQLFPAKLMIGSKSWKSYVLVIPTNSQLKLPNNGLIEVVEPTKDVNKFTPAELFSVLRNIESKNPKYRAFFEDISTNEDIEGIYFNGKFLSDSSDEYQNIVDGNIKEPYKTVKV